LIPFADTLNVHHRQHFLDEVMHLKTQVRATELIGGNFLIGWIL
jgi:hypothetical protein